MSVVEQAIRLAIGQVELSSAPDAEPIIRTIRDAHQADLIDTAQAERLIRMASDAAKHQRTRLHQRAIILRRQRRG